MRCPHLEQVFPKLLAAGYEKTSDATGYPPAPGAYNCIAWAADDTRRGFWWPHNDAYWPFWSTRQLTIESFVRAFRWLGYTICSGSRVEAGFEKVALYAAGDVPKHMARQLRDGTWTSKCGGSEDITHYTLDAVESGDYGSPILFMKRFFVVAWLVKALQFLTWKTQELISS